MTVIAYRDGVMACDSLWADPTTGSIDNLQTKIKRLKSGALYGGAGDVDERALVKMLHKVRAPTKLPSSDKLRNIKDDCDGLLVFPDGKIFFVYTGASASVCPTSLEFAAIGIGRHIAIGAMEAGLTAAGAVEATCKHNVYCRLPVHTLTLKRERKKAKR